MAKLSYTGPEGTDTGGFVVIDLDGADAADGIVRCARKVLVDGARTMARSRTYSWALLGRRVSGASAAVNAAGEHRDAAVAGFVEWVLPRVAAGEISLDPGRGVRDEELAALEDPDTRGALHAADVDGVALVDLLLASAATAASGAVLGDLDGRTVALEGASARTGPVLLDRLAEAGARVVAVGTATGTLEDPAGLDPATLAASWREDGDAVVASRGEPAPPERVLATEADVLLCGSRAGIVDHDVAGSLSCRALVPIGVAPVTARGLAVAERGGTRVVADFLTLAGPLLADRREDDHDARRVLADSTDTVTALCSESLADPEGPYLGACRRAESFLASWLDELPFGRPLA